jgi:hypothetical protein
MLRPPDKVKIYFLYLQYEKDRPSANLSNLAVSRSGHACLYVLRQHILFMTIQLPESINPEHCGQYTLCFKLHPDWLSLCLHHSASQQEFYSHRFAGDCLADAFPKFREAFYEEDFFAHPFRRIRILSYTPIFSFVPNLLFREKDKGVYMKFLFSTPSGKILRQTLSAPEITILHSLPDEIYGFFQRTFPESVVEHYTALLLERCRKPDLSTDGNRMLVFRDEEGLDVLCFNGQQFLFCNHFRCESASDAVYYALYVYKQMKFSQLEDRIYLVNAENSLQQKISQYIQNVVCREDHQWEIQGSEV